MKVLYELTYTTKVASKTLKFKLNLASISKHRIIMKGLCLFRFC